jgi:hypothetical protein
MYECLLGAPPFTCEGDAMGTCRRIARWYNYLSVPSELVFSITSHCLDFMLGLIQTSALRLGENGGAQDIKVHPWFSSIDFDTLRQGPSPLFQDNSTKISKSLINLMALETIPGDNSSAEELLEYQLILTDITSNFTASEVDEVVRGKRLFRLDKHSKFMGYTYRSPSANSLPLFIDTDASIAEEMSTCLPSHNAINLSPWSSVHNSHC